MRCSSLPSAIILTAPVCLKFRASYASNCVSVQHAVTDPQPKIATVLGTGSSLGMVGLPLVGLSSSSDCFLVHHIVKQQVAISFLSSHKERFWLCSVFSGIFYPLKLSRADIPQCTMAVKISILETNMFKEV